MFFFFAIKSFSYNLPAIDYETLVQYYWGNHTNRGISNFANTKFILNLTQPSDRGESDIATQIVYMTPSQKKFVEQNTVIPETLEGIDDDQIWRIKIVEKHRRAKMAQYVENGSANRYDVMTFWVPFVVCILTGLTLLGAYLMWSCDKYENDPVNSLMFATEGQKLVRGT